MGSRVVILRLGDITRFLDEKRLSLSRRQCEQQAGEFPYYGPQGIIARVNSFSYEGEFLLFAAAAPRNSPSPPVFTASGRFSANAHVHVLACVEEVEPRFLCRCLNALPRAALFRSPRPEAIEDIEVALLPLEDQRHILDALSDIENKKALLRDQNRVLNGLGQALFDHCFVFGGGKPRPLGDFVVFRSAGLGAANLDTSLNTTNLNTNLNAAPGAAAPSPSRSPGPLPPEDAGTAFHNLLLYPREGLPPLFTRLLVKNPEFLAHAESCLEHRGSRRINAERLMAFELNSPSGHGGPRAASFPAGAYPDFRDFALNAEKKLAANSAELKLLADIEQSLFPPREGP
jgi:hypothetical protein